MKNLKELYSTNTFASAFVPMTTYELTRVSSGDHWLIVGVPNLDGTGESILCFATDAYGTGLDQPIYKVERIRWSPAEQFRSVLLTAIASGIAEYLE